MLCHPDRVSGDGCDQHNGMMVPKFVRVFMSDNQMSSVFWVVTRRVTVSDRLTPRNNPEDFISTAAEAYDHAK